MECHCCISQNHETCNDNEVQMKETKEDTDQREGNERYTVTLPGSIIIIQPCYPTVVICYFI